jgi:hypothetical protein
MNDKPLLMNSRRARLDVDELIERCRKDDPNRILADDDVGLVLYVGDMDIYCVSGLGHPQTGDAPTDPTGHWVQKVHQISVVRFSSSVRRQIGSVVRSLPADSVFIVRDSEIVRKVKASDLKPGMVLDTGEKVYL